MNAHPVLRLVAGVLLGLALGSVPFLRYGACGHHSAPAVVHVHRH